MKKINKERLVLISSKLLEMSKGIFSSKIAQSHREDQIEAIVVQLNMLSEEFENSLMHYGYMNKDGFYFNKVYLSLLLDQDENILECNSLVSKLFMKDNSELKGSPFVQLLSKASKKHWEFSRATMKTDPEADRNIWLEFSTKPNLPLNLVCNADPFGANGATMVICSLIQKWDNEKQSRIHKITALKKMSKGNFFRLGEASLSRDDVEKIRQVTSHLLANYKEPFRSLVDLARAFGTNEYKLKQGFKLQHGETISRFVQDKRLDEAVLLMEHSDQTIKGISTMCGFKNATHFSRVFKKKYGESPKNYRKTFLASIMDHTEKSNNNPLE